MTNLNSNQKEPGEWKFFETSEAVETERQRIKARGGLAVMRFVRGGGFEIRPQTSEEIKNGRLLIERKITPEEFTRRERAI